MTISVHRELARKRINRRLQQFISDSTKNDSETNLPMSNNNDVEDGNDDDDELTDEAHVDSNKHFRKYLNETEVEQFFEQRIALSAVRSMDNRIFIVTKQKKIIELVFDQKTCVRWGGDYYFAVKIMNSVPLSDEDMVTFVSNVVDSCLVLPVPAVIKKGKVMTSIETSMGLVGWTVVTSTWLNINNKGLYTIPNLLNHKY